MPPPPRSRRSFRVLVNHFPLPVAGLRKQCTLPDGRQHVDLRWSCAHSRWVVHRVRGSALSAQASEGRKPGDERIIRRCLQGRSGWPDLMGSRQGGSRGSALGELLPFRPQDGSARAKCLDARLCAPRSPPQDPGSMLRFRSRQFWPHAGLRPTVYPISSQSRTPASLVGGSALRPTSGPRARVMSLRESSGPRTRRSVD